MTTQQRTVKISARNIWKVYGDNPEQFFNQNDGHVTDLTSTLNSIKGTDHIGAACNVSFDVYLGEIFVIMGLSGSGKSTIVRCLSRLVEPTAGEIFLDDTDLLKVSDKALIDIRRHNMGMVFQNFGLLPHLTVLENVCFPLKLQGVAAKKREQRAQEVIDLVDLAGRENSFPRELSGGQQQRVGLARSLAVEPELWFLDEPFSALDPLIRRQMQDEFLRLQKMLNKTIVFITHDFMEALRLADRIAIMKDGQIVQTGTPTELVLNPANDYVAEFTRDVPRDRVVTAGEIATLSDATHLPLAIDFQTTLDQIMPMLKEHPDGIAVEQQGKRVGYVTSQKVIDALATDPEQPR